MYAHRGACRPIKPDPELQRAKEGLRKRRFEVAWRFGAGGHMGGARAVTKFVVLSLTVHCNSWIPIVMGARNASIASIKS